MSTLSPGSLEKLTQLCITLQTAFFIPESEPLSIASHKTYEVTLTMATNFIQHFFLYSLLTPKYSYTACPILFKFSVLFFLSQQMNHLLFTRHD